VPHINFTFPTQGTTTANFSNWQLKADTVTSTDSYALTVNWDDTTGDPAQSSTIMASGTALIAGVNVPKPTSSLDYTYDGTPVVMDATATLYDATTTTATNSVSFTEDTTVAPLNCGSAQIQCISYKYDHDGNVTQVSDNSGTNAAITVNYAYDSLNRLISASSSNAASGPNYLQTFTYDPVGNILTGPKGTYSYNGTSNADSDAVTKIVNGSTTIFTYDNNGNLTNASSGLSYTWDYRNELVTASSSSATSTYGYDYLSERVKLTSGTSTILYPETTYSVNGSTTTKYISFDGVSLATITDAPSTSTTTNYVSDDMLGGTNDVTNASGALVETTQYFPYGSIRIDNATGTYAGDIRKYIGQQYDAATALSYLNARYYNGSQGQFISQDPVFLGDPNQQILSDPQSLNAYSYSEDNPIVKSDPTGKQDAGTYALGGAAILTAPLWTPEAIIGAGLIGVVGASYLATQGIMQIGSSWYRSNSTRSPAMNPNSPDAGGGGSPNPNTPKWIVGILGGVSTIAIGEKIWQSFNGQVGSTEDGFNITVNNVTSLGNQLNTSNSQPPRSSANTNARPSSPSSGLVQFGGGSGGSGGTAGLQLQILQLEVQVLQLQLQVSQSTRSTK
jgi:RHS repeat-associated protein